MTDDNFESLAKLYPDLFQKAQVDYIGCGDGWYNIIDTLCQLISSKAEQARYRLNYYTEGGNFEKAQAEEEVLRTELEKLPIIVQVKEKFGSLRFYVNGDSDAVAEWIRFAESIASRTCETCGSPGTSRNDGWIKVMCNKCHRIGFPGSYSDSPNICKTAPKLFDE